VLLENFLKDCLRLRVSGSQRTTQLNLETAMHLRALLLAAAFAAASPALIAAEPPVRLVAAPGPMAPTQTIEIRFVNEMIAPGDLGSADAGAPIEVIPEVRGKWTWQSTRSGIFTPDEPWPLGTTVQVRIRPGAAPRAEAAVLEGWRATLEFPPFAVQAWSNLSYRSQQDASAEPLLAVLFNADVHAPDLAPHCTFVRAGGEQIPAAVEMPGPGRSALGWFSQWLGADRSLLTWAERAASDALPAGLRKNQIFVRPAKPLPAGENWRLVLAAGLPANESALRTLNTVEIPVGTVLPMEVAEISALNHLQSGKRLRIALTKPLADKLDAGALARWITLTPQPAKLAASVQGRAIEYTGDFALGQEYRVSVEPGLPSSEPFVLSRGSIENVTFEPIPPRIYFEAYSTHQMRGGQRRFHLLAVNAPRIEITAKLFAGSAIPPALRGYEGYYDSPENSEDEYHSKIDAAKLPGQLLWRQVLDGTRATDEQREVALDWDQILGGRRGGVVLLTAEQVDAPEDQEKRPGAQALVQLTDIGAVWKRAPGETFLHAFSLETGRGLKGARLRMLDGKDRVLSTAKADEHGFARMPAAAPADAAEWVFVEHDGDSHVLPFSAGQNYIDLARVNVMFDEGEELPGADAIRAFVFSERGVYRPGETVHLKGIVRDYRGAKKTIPSGMKLRLAVFDARDREVLTRAVSLSAMGSFAEDLPMPESPLGFYRAELAVVAAETGETLLATHEFQVEEFKPNAFEVTIGGAPAAAGATALDVPISAKYYHGKALSKARLTWSLSASDRRFEPQGFDDVDFTDAIANYDLREHLARRSHLSLDGTRQLDEKGAAQIEGAIPVNAKAPQPRLVRVLAEVTDIDQQTVSASRTFTLDSSDFYIGLRRFRALIHTGEALPLEAAAIRTDGTPLPEELPVQVSLTRIAWENTRVETAGGGTEIRNEPKFTLIGRRDARVVPPVKEGARWAPAPLRLAEPLIPELPGEYLLELSARDAEGRPVLTTVSFEVYGPGATAWDYRNPHQVELVPERDEYTSGETAKILVKTPISGDAMVTVERERVLRSFKVRLEGNAPVVEVPLLPGDAPNVFVSVLLLRGAAESPRKVPAPEYRIGYCELSVARPEAKLAVYVRPGAKDYRPGDEVTTLVEVLDHLGKPVPNAEVTLYAVDEGVLSLTGYRTPDPLAFFNRSRPLLVSTALTLASLLNEDPEHRDFANKGYLIGGGGDEQALRKNFLACAFWHASMKTDAVGRLAAKFTAPDSLTRYRVMAVVHTAGEQFGSAAADFEVNKPVMLAPALPRFANVGDRIALRAVAHNTTALDGEAEVQFEGDETVRVDGPLSRRVPLAAGATAAVDFPVEFIATGKATWSWKLVFTGSGEVHRDAVRSTLEVGYPAPLLRHVRTLPLDGGTVSLLDGVDPQLLEGRGTVRVSLANSRAIELQEALEHLLHYPYGCIEQTTSSLLPWLVLQPLRETLPSLRRTPEESAAAIRRGTSRLLAMQTDSGGLSYWPGQSRPMLWGSAYASIALTLAQKQGHAVDAQDCEKLLKWLSEQLRGLADLREPHALRERCMAVYALAAAGRAEPAYHTLLFERRDALAAEDRALLALAIAESKGPPAMIQDLLGQQAAIEETSWFWSPARGTAIELMCWTRLQPRSRRAEELAQSLFDARRGGHWWTTQGNAWALLAMSDYLALVESRRKAGSGLVQWGDASATLALGTKAETRAHEFAIAPGRSSETLRLRTPAGQRLYGEVQIEAYPPLGEQPAQDRGYSIARTYRKIADDGTLGPAEGLRVGDRILVTLDIAARRRATYVAVEDPLPAVFEAVNPSFKTQEMRGAPDAGMDWMSDYRELREDRALFFADVIQPGRYTLRYLARVAAAGEATAPAAKIEEMYAPERCGLTASARISAAALFP
jgi:uncharacterized protein YfaS (alpha-2-macroglobulin family)